MKRAEQFESMLKIPRIGKSYGIHSIFFTRLL